MAKRQLVVFKVGDEEFGIDILLTKEVVVMRQVTPVPETEDYVEGVMNLRGNLVPVIDLRKRLRASGNGSGDERRIIVVQLERRLAGLIVDGASEVVRINESQIEPAPDIITELGVGYVLGVVNLSGRFITLIDLHRALSGEIANGLDEVMRALQSAEPAEPVVPAETGGPVEQLDPVKPDQPRARRTPRARQSR